MRESRVARVFISSTFKDMHAERDYLASVVFPELREQCRARQVELIDIDLRWGVTEEEAENGKVLDICLEEIERSRPFFVALLGERFGWVPLPEEIGEVAFAELIRKLDHPDADFLESCYGRGGVEGPWRRKAGLSPDDGDRQADLLEAAGHLPFGIPANVPEEDSGSFRWLERARAGQSVTALEIRHGVLENQAMKDRSYFYFRDPAVVASIPESVRSGASAESRGASRRQAALKAEIRAAYASTPENLNDYSPEWAGVRIDTGLLRKRGGGDGSALDELERVAGEDRLVDDSEFATLSPGAKALLAREGIVYFRRESLEDFGRQVLADLSRAIEAEFPEMPAPKTALEREAEVHARFRMGHAKGFLGRTEALGRVDAYARDSGGKALVVIGRPGSGKSALLARAVGRIAADDPESIVIESYSGASPTSQDLARLLGRLMEELRVRFGLAAPEGGEGGSFGRAEGAKGFDRLRDDFFSLIGESSRASGNRRIWLVVDAVNQMSSLNSPESLGWLPFTLQPNVRFLVSATEGAVEAAARRRGLPVLNLEPLTPDEASILVRARLGTFRKSLGFDRNRGIDQLDVLLEKDDALLPLYLAVACEELRIHPRFEDITARIESMDGTIPGLFGEVLDRLEREHGEPLVRRALSLIELSVNGLSESELLGLLAPDGEERLAPQAWARLRRSMADYLKDAGEGGEELLDVFHLQLSEAIRKRYVEGTEVVLYGSLARFGFGRLKMEWEREGYVPKGTAHDCGIYAQRAGDFGLLKEIWEGVFRIVESTENEELTTVPEASLADATGGEISEVWERFLEAFIGAPRSQLVARLLVGTGEYCEKIGRSPWALMLFRISGKCFEALAAQDPANAEWQRELGVSHHKVGGIFEAQGNLTDALAEQRKYNAILEHLTVEDQDKTDWRRELGVSHNRIGGILKAQGDLGGALAEFRKSLAINVWLSDKNSANTGWRNDLGASYNRIGSLLMAQGYLEGALVEFRKFNTILEHLAALDPTNADWQRDLSISYNRLGNVFEAMGNLEKALVEFRKYNTIMERLADYDSTQIDHQHELGVSHNCLGSIFEAQGNFESALVEFRKYNEIMERLTKQDTINTNSQHELGVSYNRIGGILKTQGNLESAIIEFRKGMEISERLSIQDPTNAGWQRELGVSHNRIGGIFNAQGNLGEALSEFLRALEISKRLTALDSSNVGWKYELGICYNRVGDILEAQGNLAEAVTEQRKYNLILLDLTRQVPINAGWQYDLCLNHNHIGCMLETQGDFEAALAEFHADLAIMERLVAQNPANAVWQSDLGVSHNKIGGILQVQGDLAEAIDEYRRNLEINELLAAQDPTNTERQNDLGMACNRIGALMETKGDYDAALSMHLRGLKIKERLVRQDPENAGWQRSLGVSLARIGGVLLVQDKLVDAQSRFQESLSVFETIRDPASPGSIFDHVAAVAFMAKTERALGHADVGMKLGLELAVMEWSAKSVDGPFHDHALPVVIAGLEGIFPACPSDLQAAIALRCIPALAQRKSPDLGAWLARGTEVLSRLPQDHESASLLRELILQYRGPDSFQ